MTPMKPTTAVRKQKHAPKKRPRNGGGGKGDRPKGDGFDAITYLYIRTHPQDTGAEPLPAGLSRWVSPDIAVVHASGVADTRATVGELVNVRVTVTNGGGVQAVGALVDVFLSEPATSFTPALAQPLGTQGVTVQGSGTADASFAWVPTPTNAGHRCLAARVALYIPPDLYVDPNVFDSRGDRHVAVRNIHVIGGVQKRRAETFGFRIAQPAKGRPGRYQVRVREVAGAKQEALLRRALGSPFAQFALKPTVRPRLVPDKVLAIADPAEPERLAKLPPAGRVSRAPKLLAEAGAAAKLELASGEVATAYVSVAIGAETRSGDLHVFEVVQVDLSTKQVVGGLWVVLQAD